MRKDIEKESVRDENEIQSAYEKYSAMNKNSLQEELFKEYAKQIESGNMRRGDLKNVEAQLSAFLSAEQRENLKALLNMLESNENK